MSKRPGFERGGSEQSDGDDALVKVRVYVRAIGEDGALLKGNISRTFTVLRSKVSTVSEAVERALFGKGASR